MRNLWCREVGLWILVEDTHILMKNEMPQPQGVSRCISKPNRGLSLVPSQPQLDHSEITSLVGPSGPDGLSADSGS